jgi:hypothetical protein
MPDDLAAIIGPADFGEVTTIITPTAAGLIVDAWWKARLAYYRNDAWWSAASAEFCRRIDGGIRRRSRGGVLPWERPVRVEWVDFSRAHAFALDRIDEILPRVLALREPAEDSTTWRGRHDDRAAWFEVSRLSGAWTCSQRNEHGGDLVGLVSAIYAIKPRPAALKLGRLLGVEVVRRG